MSTDDKALAFVGQIIKAYNAAAQAGANALSFALDCGKHLNLAMENVEETKGKGKWKKWREANLKEVSEETERLYRRLAKAVAAKPDIFDKHDSIHAAMAHLSKFEFDDDGNLKPKPAQTTTRTSRQGTGNTVTAHAASGADTPSHDPAVVLDSVDASDIIDNIKHDAEKLEEVAQRSIAKLTPDKVCGALTKAWTADQVRDLNTRLSAYLNTLATTPTIKRPLVQSNSLTR